MSDQMDVAAWLASLNLDQYTQSFVSNGYDHIDSISSLDASDLDAIGIELAGHRKRLQLAAARLANGEGVSAASPPPVTSPQSATSNSTPPVDSERPVPVPAPRRPGSIKRPSTYENLPQKPREPPAVSVRQSSLKVAVAEKSPPEPVAEEELPPTPTSASAETVAVSSPRKTSSSDNTFTPPTLPNRQSSLKSTAESSKNSIDSAAARDGAPALDQPSIEIEDETMGVLRTLTIDKKATAEEAIVKYLEQYKPTVPDSIHDAVWSLFEAYVQPPVERPIPGKAELLPIKRTWPETYASYVPGCRFVIRPVPRTQTAEYSGSAVHSGMLEKRGGSKGNTKNWKKRFFRLADEGLTYYKTEPKSQKQAARPTGVWDLTDSAVYIVRDELKVKSKQGASIKKAKRPGLLFCIKPITTPMWPGEDDKVVLSAFDADCKFMCAATEEDRTTWVFSILAAQEVSGDALDAVRKERAQTLSSLPAAAPEDDAPEVEDDDEDDEEPNAPFSAEAAEAAPANISPKKVKGIGLGDIFSEAEFDLYGATAQYRK